MADTKTGATGRASPRQYPPELKRRAIRLVLESLDRGDERQGLVTRIARQLDIGPESLRRLVGARCQQGDAEMALAPTDGDHVHRPGAQKLNGGDERIRTAE